MKRFVWKGDAAPNIGSTKTVTEVIYLAKKAGDPRNYCRVTDFDVLNTEVRA
jgi:hypothetical protein